MAFTGCVRSFTLPGDADRDAITAKFAKGVLTPEIAKTIEVHVRASYRSKGGLRDGFAGVAPGRVDARELATWETTMSPRIVTFTVNPALDVAMEARRSPPRPQNTGPAGRRTIQVVASWDEYE